MRLFGASVLLRFRHLEWLPPLRKPGAWQQKQRNYRTTAATAAVRMRE
jgi:hypothetical protein